MAAPGPSPGRKSGAEPMFPKMKSAKQDEEEAGVFGGERLFINQLINN